MASSSKIPKTMGPPVTNIQCIVSGVYQFMLLSPGADPGIYVLEGMHCIGEENKLDAGDK